MGEGEEKKRSERFVTPFEKYLAFLTSARGVDLCGSGTLFLGEFATG